MKPSRRIPIRRCQGTRGRHRPRLGFDQQRRVSVPSLICETITSIGIVAQARVSEDRRVAFGAGFPSGYGAAGKARSVIQIWMWGGPAHLDTFDPKPKPATTTAVLEQSIATNVAGVRICELLPLLAKQPTILHHSQHDPRHQRP